MTLITSQVWQRDLFDQAHGTSLIPHGDDQKGEVSKAWFITMLDAVWGFNHKRNSRRAMKRLAFVSMTGVYLPVCLPFGKRPRIFPKDDAYLF